MGLFTSLFGSNSDRAIKKIMPQVNKILELEEQFSALPDIELSGMTLKLQQRLEAGEDVDDILPEAFATVREAAWRVLGLKAFKVQLVGAIILHQGRIAEMKTGEGKTIISR